MDADALVDRIRNDYETELSRLGSSKWLYALTGGDLDGDRVRGTANEDAQTAANLFGEWATTEGDDAAAERFRAVAEAATARREQIDSESGTPEIERSSDEALRGFEGTIERLGGLVGWALIERKTIEQMVGFFVGDASPGTANAFRKFRDDVDEGLEGALELLDETCDSGDDWSAAETAARTVIEAAYDDYVETLESMGVKPKNVC